MDVVALEHELQCRRDGRSVWTPGAQEGEEFGNIFYFRSTAVSWSFITCRIGDGGLMFGEVLVGDMLRMQLYTNHFSKIISTSE